MAGGSYALFGGTEPVARGANSLPTEGREEVRAAGATRSEEVRHAVEPLWASRAPGGEARPPTKRSDDHFEVLSMNSAMSVLKAFSAGS